MLISVGYTYPDGETGSVLSPKVKAVACSSLLPGSLASRLPPQARVTPGEGKLVQYCLLPETRGAVRTLGQEGGAVGRGGQDRKLGTELWDLAG